jgi:NAD+ synthase (glutamine-hydrolysing)
MRIGIAQINSVLGDFSGNKSKILQAVKTGIEKQCDLVVLPEATIFGYHPFDLLERKDLVIDQVKEFEKLNKEIPAGISVVVGLFTVNQNKKGRPYFNSAALIQKGQRPRYFHKELLPTGDVFDEARFIESGRMKDNAFVLNVRGKAYKGFMTICEDIWAWPKQDGSSEYRSNPLKAVKGQFDFVINLSASPFFPKKLERRKELVAATAKLFKAPMVYCNLVGAQDEIVFDGHSFALSKTGDLLAECESFAEDFQVLEIGKSPSRKIRPRKLNQNIELKKALVLGIRDFCQKTGLKKVHLGLSGGVDSALVACLAVEALGSENVQCLYLPGPFSSDLSRKLADRLAKNLGIQLREVAVTRAYQNISDLLKKSLNLNGFSVAHENLQARLRGLILMALSNSENSLLLTTGNKSEYATGYSTLYGDMCGGLAPIADLTKKQVYELCEVYNKESHIIPAEILTRAPTAELRANQKDQDSLPPYDVLDQSVQNLVENSKSAKSESDQWLLKALLRTEFKRWQSAPILKVSRHSFGRGRRYPIAHQIKRIL